MVVAENLEKYKWPPPGVGEAEASRELPKFQKQVCLAPGQSLRGGQGMGSDTSDVFTSPCIATFINILSIKSLLLRRLSLF